MKAGDHVRVLRHGTWDHAIDIGDRTVIRFTPGKGLERCAYSDFVAGGERVEVVVHREPVHRPAQVVRRAFSRFAEAAFRAMFRSAEQFAVWCKNGRLPFAASIASVPAARRPVGRPAPAARSRARKASRARAAARPAPKARVKARAGAKVAKPAPKPKVEGRKRPVAKGARAAKVSARAVRKPGRRPSRRGRRQ